jgi:arylsulfatase A-like enzyme
MTHPNLLLVFADQLRARELHDPAHPLVTPAWDRLCAEGARVTQAVSNCPVCCAARAMMLTGQYPLTNRVVANDLPLPVAAETLGEILGRAGYRTGYIGKWHLDGVPRARFTPPGPRRHGFEFWAVHNCSHDYLRGSHFRDDPQPRPWPGYEPEAQTDLALEFLARRDDRPYALVLSWGPPHDPYDQVPEAWRKQYDPATLSYPASFLRAGPETAGLRPFELPWEPRRALADYYAHVTALDHQLGRLLDAVDDDTLVVYTSDHGDMLFNHGQMFKQQPWEESIGIPLALRAPGRIAAGAVLDGVFGLADLAPTLLRLLGLAPTPAMAGRDLARPVLGAEPLPDEALLTEPVACDQSWQMGLPEWRGLRTRRYTYARTRGGPWLLYDNLADPDQLDNLIDRPQMAAVRDELETRLGAWLRRVGDEFEEGSAILRRLSLVELWNAREVELHGPRARLL